MSSRAENFSVNDPNFSANVMDMFDELESDPEVDDVDADADFIPSDHESMSETGKPLIITFYNSTKGGVDALDQKCANYNTGRRTKRWPTVIFYALLNIAVCNAYVLYNSVPEARKVTRFQFIKDLAKALVEPHMRRRLQNQVLPRQLRSMISGILQEPIGPRHPPVLEKRKRCAVCPRDRDRKTKVQCRRCGKPYCQDCKADLCIECAQYD